MKKFFIPFIRFYLFRIGRRELQNYDVILFRSADSDEPLSVNIECVKLILSRVLHKITTPFSGIKFTSVRKMCNVVSLLTQILSHPTDGRRQSLIATVSFAIN